MTTKQKNNNKGQESKFIWDLIMGRESMLGTVPINIAPLVRGAVNFASTVEPSELTRDSLTVIQVANFISSIEPCYVNSEGKEVSLPLIRGVVGLGKEDFEVISEKFYEVLKSFITISNSVDETEIKSRRLHVVTKLNKKVLVKRALSHLIYGTELFKKQSDYDVVKSSSALLNNSPLLDYITLGAVATQLGYTSTSKFMEHACLTFIDQTEVVESNGVIRLYNYGTVSEVVI